MRTRPSAKSLVAISSVIAKALCVKCAGM
jgi:hypothetical protein